MKGELSRPVLRGPGGSNASSGYPIRFSIVIQPLDKSEDMLKIYASPTCSGPKHP